MTTAGSVFSAYAGEIARLYGYGSSKMIKRGDADYFRSEDRRFSDLLMSARRADASTDIQLDDARSAEEGRAAALAGYKAIADAEGWLIDNGYLRLYTRVYRYNYGIIGRSGGTDYIGLTAKGWSVAKKYINRRTKK